MGVWGNLGEFGGVCGRLWDKMGGGGRHWKTSGLSSSLCEIVRD